MGQEKFIPYYRVSDKKQGDGETSGTGYGIEAQRRDVEYWRERRNAVVVESQTEIGSGGNDNRPKLKAAIARCLELDATLVVARLDRLARSVGLINDLMHSKVKFLLCDFPDASPLTIHILAAVAEDELQRIRSRTKVGLASAKRKGVLLGSARPGHWEGREHLRGWNAGLQEYAKQKSAEIRHCYEHLLPLIEMMRQRGDTYQQITDWLNLKGYKTSKNRPFSKSVVHEITVRYLGSVEKTACRV